MAYAGPKGCVMAGDKRRIAFFGDKTNREKLEEQLYNGSIKNDDDLYKIAKGLGLTLKITDDNSKIDKVKGSEVLVGEVKTSGTSKTQRKRVYATTNGYQIVELLGSEIVDTKSGHGSVVVFGNKKTQEMAESFIQKEWNSKFKTKDISNLFEKILTEIAKVNPSVSKQYDILIKSPKLDKKESQKLLRETVVRDVKILSKWREKIHNELLETAESIKLAQNILSNGEVGRIIKIEGNNLQIILGNNVCAYDIKWKPIAKSGDYITMTSKYVNNISIGDLVVIENEIIQIKNKKDVTLESELIVCKTN